MSFPLKLCFKVPKRLEKAERSFSGTKKYFCRSGNFFFEVPFDLKKINFRFSAFFEDFILIEILNPLHIISLMLRVH